MNSDLEPITSRFSVNRNKHLGKGCYGSVYEGYDNQNNKKIAIKHLNQPQNFKDEVETLEKLSTLTHPYIMDFYGYKADKNDVYFFIEYCPGGTLTDLIKKGLDEEQTLNLLRQLVEGMCYMNAKGIMHRDLKPDNILIGAKNDIKISDFGLAKVEDGLEKTGQMGTPLYAGPQIFLNTTDAYNFNCDVWSAGLILHEMLTRTHPFDHIKTIYELKNQWRLFERGQKRVEYPKTIHPQWEYINNIMLTFNYKKRPFFHDILQLLKKLDDNGTMRQEIRDSKKGINKSEDASLSPLERYLNFLDQKSDFIVQLAKSITPESYPSVPPSLQDLLIFIGLTWYIIKIKNLIRSLKFKNLKFPNKQDVMDSKNPDNKSSLIMDNYRNIFEAKLTKNQNYYKEKVMPRLAQHETKPNDLNLFKSNESAYKLYQEVKQGAYDVEDTYAQQFLKLLSYFKFKPSEQKMSNMSASQKKIYIKILMTGFLNTELPDQMYDTRDFVKNKLQHIDKMSPAQLDSQMMRLRSQLA